MIMNRLLSLYVLAAASFLVNYTSICKGIFFLEERNGQTVTFPVEGDVTEGIEDHILDILELDEPPSHIVRKNRDNKVAIFMSNLYQEMEREESGVEIDRQTRKSIEHWINADKIISLSASGVAYAEPNVLEVKFLLNDIPSDPDTALISAQMRVFIPDSISSGIAKITVFTKRTGVIHSVDSSIITPHTSSVGFNITILMNEWIHRLSLPSVFIRIDTAMSSSFSMTLIDFECFIVAAFIDENGRIPRRRTRARRAVNDGRIVPPNHKTKRAKPIQVNEENSSFDICRKQGLYVDFEDLGWKVWVIAPEGYMANYCTGACPSDSPLHSRMNATNHAIVQTLVHVVDPQRAEEAKCVPAQLAPAKILFIDNHQNVVMKRYRDMVVQECGCH